jgi:hypothetical protein
MSVPGERVRVTKRVQQTRDLGIRKRRDRTGQDRTGQGRTGQYSTGQDRTGQDRTGQDRTGQDRTGYSPIQSSSSSLSLDIACTDIRATMSVPSTTEVTYSLHSVQNDDVWQR